MGIISSTIRSVDHHSGWTFVPVDMIVVIALYKQMLISGRLKIEGRVEVIGRLALV